jgi:hypothetical protein
MAQQTCQMRRSTIHISRLDSMMGPDVNKAVASLPPAYRYILSLLGFRL